MLVKQAVVTGFDWAVVGIAAVLFFFSILGAVYAFRYSSLRRRAVAKEFNYLWRFRSFTQVLAALYCLSLLLRLQIFWGPESVFKRGGYHPITFCRAYTALTYGVFEPGFLLLALFACMYSIQGRESSPNPNFNIVFFSVGFSLPACAAQLVVALFTRIFSLDYTKRTNQLFFAVYDDAPATYCTKATDGNCAFCTFPLLSTLVSVAFSAVYLVVLLIVTNRIAAAVINKLLVRRVRLLQLLVTLFLILSLACRGVTVVFRPFDAGFEVLRLAHLVCAAALVFTIEYVLVLKPVYDSRVADKTMKMLDIQGQTFPQPLIPPTEMLPLPSSRSDDSRV